MILHIDMDAFFAAVEQRDNPALKNKPVIVSGKSKRSVVSTASYEARQFGIHSAMPVFKALKKCPDIVIVPGNRKKYAENSARIMGILERFSPMVEQVSIDEAFLDISGCERLFGTPEQMANRIKEQIFSQLALTCSIGIAPLKFLAKIASDMKKPDGLTIIRSQDVPDVISRLPIQKVPGVGRHAMAQMASLKIKTLGDVRKFPASVLHHKFGSAGERLAQLSAGIDTAQVRPHPARKSISSETTLETDIAGFDDIKKILLDRSQTVGRLLRKKNLVCRKVFIKLKFSDFTQITRQTTLAAPACASRDIFNAALELFKKTGVKKKIRLAGVGVSILKDKNLPVQMELLPAKKNTSRQWESVEGAVDSILDKFGTGIVHKASLNHTKDRRSLHE